MELQTIASWGGVVLFILGVIYSLSIIEGTPGNNCAAVERLGMRKVTAKNAKTDSDIAAAAMAGAFLDNFSNGRVVAAMAAKKMPELPAPVACGFLYWIGINQPV